MDLEMLRIKEKMQLLAKMRAFGIVRGYQVGGSVTVILPRLWLDLNCPEIDGERYFKIEVEENRIIISPVELEDLAGIEIKRKDNTDDRNCRPREDNQGSPTDRGNQG